MNKLPFIIPAGEGKSYSVSGGRYTILADSSVSNGSFDIIECTVPPQTGTPPHIHRREDEIFYIVEGALEFEIDGKKTRAEAGSFVFAPRDVPHCFKNVDKDEALVVIVAQPSSNLTEFFKAVGSPLPDRKSKPAEFTQQAIEKMLELAPKFGIEILN